MEKGRPTRRRTLLRALGASSAIALAGCNENQSSPSGSTDGTAATTDARTGTTRDKQPPTVEQFDAVPEQRGTVLDVSMTVTDDRALDSATIRYGDRTVSAQLDGTTAEIDDRLTEVATSDAAEPGAVQYRVRDAAGNETAGTVAPDATAPSLAVEPWTPGTAGAIQLTIEGEDDVGLSELRVALNGEAVLRESVTGQTAVSVERTVSTDAASEATVGERNDLQVVLTDALGNATSQAVTQYVRKYDKMENPRLNLGGLYMSQAGDALTNNLSDEPDTEPAVGIYNSPIPPEITSRHIDQMTAFGFTHVGYDFGGVPQSGWSKAFLKSDLANQIDILPTYIKSVFDRTMDRNWKTEILPRDLSYLRERFLSRDNAVTIDGRPVLDSWNWRVLAVEEEKRTKLMDEFGSFEAFVDTVRDLARTERGDPHLMFGIGAAGAHLDHEDLAPLRELAKQFDTITTWFHGTRGGWDAVIDRAIADFEGCRQFANEHDMEFVPLARPGYDERWDTGDYRTTERYLPRDPDRLRQLLQLCDQYRTTDRVFVPYNDWIEGHTIEPGTFTGTDYGTTYLEVVEEFQRSDG